MSPDEKRVLSSVRLEKAKSCLEAAQLSLHSNDYYTAANRAYYAVFHAMRAILALDGIDRKHHSGIISEFRRLYIKTGIFSSELSDIITEVYDVRERSDYDDFYVLVKSTTIQEVEDAVFFLNAVESFLNTVDV